MTVHPDDSAVRLVDTRPETWRARAAEFAERIHAAVPDALVRHIGSTSFTGDPGEGHGRPAGGRQWERRVRFRDALREDEDARLAREHEELKTTLASEGIGLDEYTQRKTDFVRAVMD